MRVIGIESSCDETGVAIYDSKQGLMGHVLYSQVKLHQQYGGVVPELASRDHIKKTLPLIRELMMQTRCNPKDINGVAYTAGPGLMGALLVGAGIGRSLAWAWGVPAIGVHHMEGHLLAPMLEEKSPAYPFLALLVSGGHTLLVTVRDLGQYELLGESVDDAAGEAFDKTAKMLGLGYPGGPALAACAEAGVRGRLHFPRPMTNRPGLNFSFSGLKTHARTTWMESEQSEQDRADIAWAFQDAVVDTMVIKCRRALKQTGLKQLVVAGGVSANRFLRTRLAEVCETLAAQVFYPRPEFCTDNAAMIAYAGWLRLQAGQSEDVGFSAKPRWPLSSLD